MKSKILTFLLSVFFAFGLWLYVITVVSPDTTDTIGDIPVTMIGESALEQRNLIITATTSTNVDLTLTGNRSDLVEVNAGNITLTADLTRIYDPGVHRLEYSISWPGSVADNAFTVENKYPAYVTITVEKKATKEIPVEIVWNGAVPSDFMSDKENVLMDYENITIKGPSSVVDKISHAEITVDLTDQRESLDQNYRITLCDKDHEPVNAELITVNTQEVNVKLTIHKVKEVPLVVTIVDGGGATSKTATYEILPKSIKVSGTEAALEDLEQINLGTIKLADYAEAQMLNFAITLPDGVTNQSNVTEAKVDLQFPGLITRDFTITGEQIKIINVPEGMEAVLITENLTVTVRGSVTDINRMTIRDITVTVDFADAPVGTSTYKVMVTFPEAFPTVGALGKPNVSATLQEAED
jgi:YbbR domain-containing protein